jgi:hypothetical protein
MNEKELGEALLKYDTTKSSLGSDPRELTAAILDRDRRRLRRWGMVAGALWVVALAGIMLIFVVGGFAFPRIAYLLQQNPELNAAGEQSPFVALAKITAMNIVVTSGSMVSLVFAGLGTLVLVRASRQATLRQVNAGLVDICEQLRQLRTALSK